MQDNPLTREETDLLLQLVLRLTKSPDTTIARVAQSLFNVISRARFTNN